MMTFTFEQDRILQIYITCRINAIRRLRSSIVLYRTAYWLLLQYL